jgi:hypothetical protein
MKKTSKFTVVRNTDLADSLRPIWKQRGITLGNAMKGRGGLFQFATANNRKKSMQTRIGHDFFGQLRLGLRRQSELEQRVSLPGTAPWHGQHNLNHSTPSPDFKIVQQSPTAPVFRMDLTVTY